MQREQRYVCGGNFFWQSVLQSPIPGVPLSWSRLQELISSQYSGGPSSYQGMITLKAGRDDDPMTMCGGLLRLSPEELSRAFVVAISQDINSGADEERLQLWLKHARSCCVVFVEPQGVEGAYWEAFNLREHIVASNALVQRTAVQRAVELHQFKGMRAKDAGMQTHETIAAAYKSRAKMGSSDEKVDVSYVRSLLAVYDKFCEVPKLMELISELENIYGLKSCLNSVSKLVKLAEKAESEDMRIYCVEFLVDQIKAGNITNASVTREFLTGTGVKKDSRHPFVQLCHFRVRLKKHILGLELPRNKFPPQDIRKLEQAFATIGNFRLMVEPLEGVADTQWIGGMQQSSSLALRILQDPHGLFKPLRVSLQPER